jgi:ABC-type oligopeptide transport system substrate-binding subunit
MIGWKIAAAAAVAMLVSSSASAAPAGKVVIAQGVDPTTLDMANQSESPASNVGRHIFDTLYERDPNLKNRARPRHRDTEVRAALGVGSQATPRREVP